MIELRHVTKRYGDVVAVDDVSLSVERGELLVLLGASGSGKTTTLKMINRLIEPSTGTVRIDGEDTGTLPPHELRRRIGYVFQKIGLFPHMTVAENVAVTPTLLGWDRARIERRVHELLDGEHVVTPAPRLVRRRHRSTRRAAASTPGTAPRRSSSGACATAP